MLLSDLTVSPISGLGLSFPGGATQYYPSISEGGMGTCRISASWTSTIAGIKNRCDALRALGIQPFLTFECNDEARTRTDTHGITNQIPLDMNEWLAFVTDVVNQGPAIFQVVNEWNGADNPAGGWKGTPQELIDFVSATAGAIKAADPSATVHMGGITPGALDALVLNRGLANYEICTRQPDGSFACNPASYYQNPVVDAEIDKLKVILAGVGPFVDGLDLHLYGPADRDPVRIQAIKGEGWAKPLISAECGGPSLHYEDYVDSDHFMEVCERMLGILANGLPYGLWFRLSEGEGTSFGNSRTALSAAGVPKPGLWAMKFLAHVLQGATGVTGGNGNYTVSHPDGDRLIAWGEGIVHVPHGKVWKITDPVAGEYSEWTINPEWTVWLSLGQWPLAAGL